MWWCGQFHLPQSEPGLKRYCYKLIYKFAVLLFGLGMSGEYACASTCGRSWNKVFNQSWKVLLVSGFSVGNIIAAQIIPQFAEVYGWSSFYRPVTSFAVLWDQKKCSESQEWIEDKYKDKSTFCILSSRKPHLSISMIVFLVCFCLFGANWPINGPHTSFLPGR